jgi:hypothetical protein
MERRRQDPWKKFRGLIPASIENYLQLVIAAYRNQAVLAERQRCATIAETYESAGMNDLEYATSMIVSRIRSGEQCR